MDRNYFKGFIRVVKSLSNDSDYYFGDKNIVSERMIEANTKDEAKQYLLKKYPQFFQNGKIYTKETKDEAQFFYVVIYPVYAWEKKQIENGEWKCAYCEQVHENEYVDRPRRYEKLFGSLLFCSSDDDYCLEQYKADYYKDIELPDDDVYIKKTSPNYIYKITEKATGKCYIGKTRNEPFFRWWNHLTHSSSPFGLYLRQTKLSDWTFEVLDILPAETADSEIFKIESEYIIEFDSINNGFNTVISNKEVLDHANKEKSLINQLELDLKTT